MKAIPFLHTKLKLREIFRDLYIRHGWEMPQGFLDRDKRNPLNMSFGEWQQAKRLGQNPRAIKQAFQDSWAISDNKAAFAAALKERGFILAKGDRRGFNDLRVSADFSGALGLVAADVNGDTREDLIAISGARPYISDQDLRLGAFIGLPSGGFDLPTSSQIITGIDESMTFGEYRDLAAADFNGDGALNLVTLNEDSHDLFISYGFGDGTFGDETTTPNDVLIIPLDNNINPYDLVIADFDGNALPDIAFAESALEVSGQSGAGTVQIFLNPGQ